MGKRERGCMELELSIEKEFADVGYCRKSMLLKFPAGCCCIEESPKLRDGAENIADRVLCCCSLPADTLKEL